MQEAPKISRQGVRVTETPIQGQKVKRAPDQPVLRRKVFVLPYGHYQWRIQIFWKGKAENNLSAPSSFIANAHNEIYAFYT